MTNPYLNAKQEWNEMVGSSVSRAKLMTVLCFLLTVSNILCMGVVVYLLRENRVVPYVMVLNDKLNPIAMGTPDSTNLKDKRVLKSFLADFIKNLRGITADSTVLKNQYETLYAMLRQGSPAYKQISSRFREESPFERARRETVSIQVSSIIKQSDTTWEIEWSENVFSRTGERVRTSHYRAHLTLSFSKTLTPSQAVVNPLGVIVRELDISEKML